MFETTIERLAAGGDGVGRHPDGITVFVPLSAPGDRLRVRETERRRRFVRAEIEAVLVPGPDRVAPPCPVFGRCGGCAWQHLAYPAQVEAKRGILADAMRRIGGHALPGPPPVTPSPAAYGYRARARVLARAGEVGFRARRSHVLCAVDGCPILEPALEGALADVAHRSRGDDALREWTIAAGSDGATSVALADRAPRGGARAPAAPEGTGAPVTAIGIAVGDDRIALSPGAFGQASGLLRDALHARVVEAAGHGDRLLELFAGAGFFTLALARRFGRVEAVEADPVAVADLRCNLARAGCGDVHVVEASAERALPRGVQPEPDVVVLDPPRRGLTDRAARGLLRVAPRRVVYVSCDPATLARDTARLVAAGYALRGVEGFDLFPQTPHLEAVAVLEREADAREGPDARTGVRTRRPARPGA